MPLEPLDQLHLQGADGFSELGMFEEANASLEEIDRNRPSVCSR